jgi:hypothetical protein
MRKRTSLAAPVTDKSFLVHFFKKELLVLLSSCLIPAVATAATLEAGSGKRYAMPSEAIAQAEPGDTVAIYPGQYFDCAVVTVPHLTIVGMGDPAEIVLTDKTCQEKAILVIEAPYVTVRNLTLTRARVPDENGAGIRMEGGTLTVSGVHFINNQDGILTAPGPTWVLSVSDSLFEKNGTCKQYCAHAIYAGGIGLLQVRNSVFRGTKEGHHIKSRALSTDISGCTIEDGPNGTASYLIEVPNGGSLSVRGSTLEKGPRATNNSAAIVIGSEGVSQPTPEIVVENNDFTNDMPVRTIFVRNLTATEADLKGNHLHGKVEALEGDGNVN